jgi:hypothetical protein
VLRRLVVDDERRAGVAHLAGSTPRTPLDDVALDPRRKTSPSGAATTTSVVVRPGAMARRQWTGIVDEARARARPVSPRRRRGRRELDARGLGAGLERDPVQDRPPAAGVDDDRGRAVG